MCWLRLRDTYPATVVAPLSKGDANAVTLVHTFCYLKRLADCLRESPLSEGYGEAGGYVSENRCRLYYFKEDFCDLCWLRQRDTYPATVVAPLSKGDADAMTLVHIYADAVTFVPLCCRCDACVLKSIWIETIFAGSASGIHTPPLSWHPFQKGTLAR